MAGFVKKVVMGETTVQYCEETLGLLKVCSYAALRLHFVPSVSASMLTLSATV